MKRIIPQLRHCEESRRDDVAIQASCFRLLASFVRTPDASVLWRTLSPLCLPALIFLLTSSLFLHPLSASQPAWWTARGAINTSLTPNDYAVVNEGQLKKMTYEVVQEMNAKLSGGAGTALNNLATGWSTSYQSYGLGTNDYQTMNVGQLKYIANLIYAPLIANGYMAAAPAWLHVNSQVDPNLATIGQLKSVFAFEVAVPKTPANLTVVFGSTQATLNWSDPVISIQNFTIQSSTDGGATWSNLATVAGNTTTATVTGLTLGANYTFQVTASNAAGTSTPSTSDAAPIISLSTPSGATLVP